MKNNRFKRFLATMLTLIMTSMLITPVLAAAKYEKIDENPVAKKNLPGVRAAFYQSVRATDGQTDFSPEDLEQMRSALFELLDGTQELSALVSPQPKSRVKNQDLGEQKTEDSLGEIRSQIQQMSGKQLATLRKSINPSKLRAKISSSRAALGAYRDSVLKAASDSAMNTPGLPGINSFCGGPTPPEAIIAADAVLFAAELVRDLAQDACNEVIVIVGEGGNGRLACIITDGIYNAAKIANVAIHFCDDDYSSSVGQASFDRLGHIHNDLADVKANDNTNYNNIIGNAAANTTTITTDVTNAKNTIVNNDNSNKDTIVNNDNFNRTAIINNDNSNKTAIINNDNANTVTITTAVENAKTTIVVNANANRDELIRLHIAADLASVDNATSVAVFMLPAVKGGYLELVRTIVVQAITQLAGSSASQANSFLAQGDAAKTAGDYKKAYFWYRKAYKAATN